MLWARSASPWFHKFTGPPWFLKFEGPIGESDKKEEDILECLDEQEATKFDPWLLTLMSGKLERLMTPFCQSTLI